jgi:ribosome-binding factor A
MNSIRLKKLEKKLHINLSSVFHFEIDKQEFKKITITDVKLNSNLSKAIIYYTFYDDQLDFKKLNNLLNSKKYQGIFRNHIFQRLDWFNFPSLDFKYDDSLEKLERIENILKDD